MKAGKTRAKAKEREGEESQKQTYRNYIHTIWQSSNKPVKHQEDEQ